MTESGPNDHAPAEGQDHGQSNGHEPGDDGGHSHGGDRGHGHGNERDRGLTAMIRYGRNAGRMWRSEINDAIVARIDPRPGETVVDIGAGVGAGTMIAASAGARVVAIEPTPYMRRILGWRRLASRHRSDIEIHDASAEALGIESHSVDAAWAVNTMHHWNDLATGVAEVARVLKPGGRITLADEDFSDPAHPDHESFKQRHKGGHGFHMVDVDAVASHLRAAGLKVTTAAKQQVANRPVILLEARAP